MTKITHVAVKINQQIYSLPAPNRHHNVLRHITKMKVARDYGQEIEGFLDENGKFLNRYDAYVLAVRSGQINRPTDPKLYQGPELYSEDLW